MAGFKSKCREKLYHAFYDAKRRCENPNRESFKYYGARGIKFEWSNFEDFFSDMSASWKDGLSLDRKNNSGNYNKNNCRWATALEQTRNRRITPHLTFSGVEKTVNEWAEFIGVKPSTLWMRLNVYKWPLRKCLTKRSVKRKRFEGNSIEFALSI